MYWCLVNYIGGWVSLAMCIFHRNKVPLCILLLLFILFSVVLNNFIVFILCFLPCNFLSQQKSNYALINMLLKVPSILINISFLTFFSFLCYQLLEFGIWIFFFFFLAYLGSVAEAINFLSGGISAKANNKKKIYNYFLLKFLSRICFPTFKWV